MSADAEEVRVRPATAGDAEFIQALVPAFVDFGVPAGRDPDELATAFARDLAEALRAGAAIFVAEGGGGERLGFIHLHSATDVTGRPRAHVGDLAVAPAAQGRGVGRTLMAHAESWAVEQGHDRIGLTAIATNERAIGFYRELGFVEELVSLSRPVGAPAGPEKTKAP